ncbi:hypothetical protein LTR08_008122 [Meristemomyces frigidus]|nr:hypothetical protein LTR08_008122 [Meristemomyces frigidus]
MPVATGNTAPALTSITIFFFCWAVLTFALRLWVKLPKRGSWGVDDIVISLALVRTGIPKPEQSVLTRRYQLAALVNVCATFQAVKHGFGVAWSALSDPQRVEKVLYVGQLSYVASMGAH